MRRVSGTTDDEPLVAAQITRLLNRSSLGMLSGKRENLRDAFGDLPGAPCLLAYPTRTDICLASCTSVAPLDQGITGSKVPARDGAGLRSRNRAVVSNRQSAVPTAERQPVINDCPRPAQ